MIEQKKLIRYLITGALFFIVGIFFYLRATKIEENYKFNGIIEKITFGEKGTPEVIIKGEKYFVTFPNRDFADEMRVGDSLIKMKQSRIYKLIKKNTKQVIISQ